MHIDPKPPASRRTYTSLLPVAALALLFFVPRQTSAGIPFGRPPAPKAVVPAPRNYGYNPTRWKPWNRTIVLPPYPRAFVPDEPMPLTGPLLEETSEPSVRPTDRPPAGVVPGGADPRSPTEIDRPTDPVFRPEDLPPLPDDSGLPTLPNPIDAPEADDPTPSSRPSDDQNDRPPVPGDSILEPPAGQFPPADAGTAPPAGNPPTADPATRDTEGLTDPGVLFDDLPSLPDSGDKSSQPDAGDSGGTDGWNSKGNGRSNWKTSPAGAGLRIVDRPARRAAGVATAGTIGRPRKTGDDPAGDWRANPLRRQLPTVEDGPSRYDVVPTAAWTYDQDSHEPATRASVRPNPLRP